MARDGWRKIGKRLPRENEDRRILVWHAYQGVLVVPFSHLHDNRFFLCWQELPEQWIATAERLPTREDADAQGAVISLNRHGEVRTLGWHQIRPSSIEEHWMPPPPPPANHIELRRIAEQEDLCNKASPTPQHKPT